MLPPIKYQHGIRQLMAKIGALKRMQRDTAAEMDAMLPSILDKAFKICWSYLNECCYIIH